MLKTIRRNLGHKNSDKLKKFILLGVLSGGLMLQSTVALAAAEGENYADSDGSTNSDSSTDSGDTDSNITNPYAYNTIEVDDSKIIFNGVEDEIESGYSLTIQDKEGSGDVTYNKLTINGNSAEINIDGGNFSGNFTYNEIIFNGGRFSYHISGDTAYSGTFANNNFTINGGTFSNEYERLENLTATNNTWTISGTPDISNAYILAGFVGVAGTSSGNVLNFNTSGLTAKNIYDFNTINFNVPDGVTNGATLLTLTEGETDLSNSTVNANISGGTSLNSGDKINLITNENTIIGGDSSSVNIAEGSTVNYEGSTITNDGTNLVLTLGDAKINEGTKAFSQGVLNTSGTLTRGTDRIIDWLPPEELVEAVADGESISQHVSNHFGIFANFDASKLRTKTGGGSYVDTKGGGINLGSARALEDSHGGSLIFAPLVDYGKTRFDSYLADGTHGSGHSRYLAGGLIGRKTWNNGVYLEGSFRAGSSKTDFASDDLVSSYSESTPVFAGHVRAGRLLRMDKNNLFHFYGIYSHNHMNGFSANLSSGEHYDFDSVDSGKFMIGYRLTTRVSNLSKIYTGLAYQYEFNGSTSARYKDFTTTSAEIKGSSGMLELGWQLQAQKNSAWLVDFNATGWIGIQKGVTASAKIKKSF